MKSRTAVVLTVLLLACVAYIVGRSVIKFSKPDVPLGAKKLFPTAAPIVKLRIEPAGAAAMAFSREGYDWRITEPVNAKADGPGVDELADALVNLEYQREFDAKADDAADDQTTGLPQPLWRVELTDQDGVSHGLLVGRAVPLSGGQETYVRTEAGGHTFVVQRDLASLLEVPLSRLRDKTVLELAAGEVESLRVDGRQSFKLQQTGGKWALVEPLAAPAEQARVRQILGKLSRLQASAFVGDQPASLAAYGLDRPRVLVTVQMMPPASQPAATQASQPLSQPSARVFQLAFGASAQDSVYAKLADQPDVFQLPASILEELQPSPAQLRRKLLVEAAAQDVRAIELSTAEGPVALELRDGRWFMTSPHQGPASKQAVDALLDSALSLAAESFPDQQVAGIEAGIDQPRARVTLAIEEKPAISLAIGSPSSSGEMTFVRSSQQEAIAVVKAAEVSPLLVTPAGLWDRTLFQLPQDMEIVAVETHGRDWQARVDRASRQWRLVDAGAKQPDAQALDTLLETVRQIDASQIVAIGKSAPADIASDPAVITLALTAEQMQAQSPSATAPADSQPATAPARHKYVIHLLQRQGADGGQEALVWMDGRQTVAVGRLDMGLYNKLTAELRPRQVFSFDPAAVSGFSIAAGPKVLEFARRHDGWVCLADPYVPLDGEKIDKYLQKASRLQAERFVRLDQPQLKDLTERPWLSLTVRQSSQPPDSLKAGAAAAGQDRYAVSSDGRTMLLSSQSLAELAKTLEDFRRQ